MCDKLRQRYQNRIPTVREILTNNQSKENPNSARDTNATIHQKNILTLDGKLTQQSIKRKSK